MLDNRYAVLFIRGERPVMDEKFDILKHPDVALTTDGRGKPYRHGEVTGAVAGITLGDSFEGEYTGESTGGFTVKFAGGEEEISSYELLAEEELEEIFWRE